MKLFHGTTLNRFNQMQETGFLGTYEGLIWNISAGETTYFWTEEHIISENSFHDIDGNIEDLVIDAGIRMAAESSEIALSSERTNLRRVVLMIESEDLDQELLGKDDSCENMRGAVQYSGLIPLDKVKKMWIDSEALDLFALYFVGFGLSRNTEYNGGIRVNMGENENLPYGVQEGAKKLFEAMALDWIEDINYHFELEEYYIGENATLINSYSHYQLQVN